MPIVVAGVGRVTWCRLNMILPRTKMGYALNAVWLQSERVSDIMLRRAILWLARKLAASVGGEITPVGQRKVAISALEEMGGFMARSGFLRDGRYSGGRHAERKLWEYGMRAHHALLQNVE